MAIVSFDRPVREESSGGDRKLPIDLCEASVRVRSPSAGTKRCECLRAVACRAGDRKQKYGTLPSPTPAVISRHYQCLTMIPNVVAGRRLLQA